MLSVFVLDLVLNLSCFFLLFSLDFFLWYTKEKFPISANSGDDF